MIFGVDLGMRRAAVACPEVGIYTSFDLGKTPGDRHAELAHMTTWFREVVQPEATVWVEAPIAGLSGNVQTAVKLAMSAGAIFGIDRPGEMFLVAPSTWKAAVVGHGHSDKDQVKAWVEARFPESAAACAGIEDRYDAAAIAWYGELVSRRGLGPARKVQGRRTGKVLRAGRGTSDAARGSRASA